MANPDMKKIKSAIKEAADESLTNRIQKDEWLSSGSHVLNLVCSGQPYGAYAKGKFFWMVGASGGGKTSLGLTALAEASINKNFDDYDLIFNNGEDGALMDLAKFFGQRLANRIKPPEIRDGEPYNSRTVDEFYDHLDTRLELARKGKAPPFIELLDSMDNLSSDQEQKKRKEQKEVRAKNAANDKKAPVPGEQTDGKAKLNSKYLRDCVARLQDSGSILIIVSQERDNMGGGPFEPENTVSGGRALKFYASWQLWLHPGRSLSITHNGKKRKIGQMSNISVKKNRLTGKEWNVEIPMYFSTGIDDVGGMVDFLLSEKFLETRDKGAKILIPEFSFEGDYEELIQHVSTQNFEQDLVGMTVEAFRSLEAACKVSRKSRYE